jgi:two-component system heavy metal sensor histidine kinase CusS
MRLSLSQPVSLTARLAILFATLSAGLLVIAGIFFGRMLETHFQELDVHELQGKLTLIRTALQGDGLPSASSGRMAALENSFVGHDNVGVLLRALDGRVLEVIHPGFGEQWNQKPT